MIQKANGKSSRAERALHEAANAFLTETDHVDSSTAAPSAAADSHESPPRSPDRRPLISTPTEEVEGAAFVVRAAPAPDAVAVDDAPAPMPLANLSAGTTSGCGADLGDDLGADLRGELGERSALAVGNGLHAAELTPSVADSADGADIESLLSAETASIASTDPHFADVAGYTDDESVTAGSVPPSPYQPRHTPLHSPLPSHSRRVRHLDWREGSSSSSVLHAQAHSSSTRLSGSASASGAAAAGAAQRQSVSGHKAILHSIGRKSRQQRWRAAEQEETGEELPYPADSPLVMESTETHGGCHCDALPAGAEAGSSWRHTLMPSATEPSSPSHLADRTSDKPSTEIGRDLLSTPAELQPIEASRNVSTRLASDTRHSAASGDASSSVADSGAVKGAADAAIGSAAGGVTGGAAVDGTTGCRRRRGGSSSARAGPSDGSGGVSSGSVPLSAARAHLGVEVGGASAAKAEALYESLTAALIDADYVGTLGKLSPKELDELHAANWRLLKLELFVLTIGLAAAKLPRYISALDLRAALLARLPPDI